MCVCVTSLIIHILVIFYGFTITYIQAKTLLCQLGMYSKRIYIIFSINILINSLYQSLFIVSLMQFQCILGHMSGSIFHICTVPQYYLFI